MKLVFGVNDKSVLDKSYRDALVMKPDDFATTFDPGQHGIIDSIQLQMAEDYNIKSFMSYCFCMIIK